jgi:hypothetical protein
MIAGPLPTRMRFLDLESSDCFGIIYLRIVPQVGRVIQITAIIPTITATIVLVLSRMLRMRVVFGVVHTASGTTAVMKARYKQRPTVVRASLLPAYVGRRWERFR